MPEKSRKLRVTVLGGGSWGTTVAALVARNAPVTLWMRDPEAVTEINTHHSNKKYLANATLPKNMAATTNLQQAVEDTDVLVIGIPSQGFRQVLEQAKQHIRPWIPIISLTKGLELSTGKRMSEIIEEILPGHPVGVLTGPNLAREILAGQAAATVLAMKDQNIVTRLQQVFNSGLFRVYTNDDVVGCELGGVLKNIIAIAKKNPQENAQKYSLKDSAIDLKILLSAKSSTSLLKIFLISCNIGSITITFNFY